MKALGERLGRFKPRRHPRRPEQQAPPPAANTSAAPSASGCSGPTTVRIGPFGLGQRQNPRGIRRVDGNRAHSRLAGDTGVAGSTHHASDVRVVPERGHQGVLARAATHHEQTESLVHAPFDGMTVLS